MPRRCLLAVLCGALALGAALPAAAGAAGGALVISQISPGIGSDRQPFVSLLNRTTQPINLAGLNLAVRGKGGAAWANVATFPNVDVPAGRSFLVSFGDPRLTPDPTTADMLSLGLFLPNAATLAIVQGDVLLSCQSTAECSAESRIADLVAYGNSEVAEGPPLAAEAPLPPGGIVRRGAGCQDTDVNAADLEVAASLTPVTLASGVAAACGATTAPPVASCGAGRLNVGAGRTGTRLVSATDPDDRVVDFAVTLAPNGIASVATVTPSAAVGAPGSAEIVIPANAAPGTYTATVTVSSGGAGLQKGTCTFPITVATPTATAGTTTTKCIVPNVRNLTLAKARSRLKAKGCAAGRVKRPRGLRKGLVVRKQSRKAGTKVKRGTKVNLTLGRRAKKK